MVDRMDVFTTQPNSQPGGKPFWLKVGVAFAQRSGGYSIELGAMPIPMDGKARLVMLPPRENDARGGWNAGGAAPARPARAPTPVDPHENEEPAPW